MLLGIPRRAKELHYDAPAEHPNLIPRLLRCCLQRANCLAPYLSSPNLSNSKRSEIGMDAATPFPTGCGGGGQRIYDLEHPYVPKYPIADPLHIISYPRLSHIWSLLSLHGLNRIARSRLLTSELRGVAIWLSSAPVIGNYFFQTLHTSESHEAARDTSLKGKKAMRGTSSPSSNLMWWNR